MELTFSTTASFCKRTNKYKDFGIFPQFSNIYGVDKNDIKQLTLKISEEQSKDIDLFSDNISPDYWGYYSFEKQKFILIYPKYFLLNMCFPYGIKALEERNDGKAYRLEIVEVKDLENV